MTSTLIKYNVILILLCIGITLIHNSSEATVNEDVILYYNHLSPQCRSVLLTLGALDLNITLKSIDFLKGEKLPEEFREMNSLQTLPVLKDDKFAFFESDAIIVYLVQQYGVKDNLLYPSKCPTFQSLIIQQLIFNNINFYSAFEILHTAGISCGKQKTIEEVNKIHKALNSFEETLGKSAWAVGKIMTVADFALVASISTFDATGFDLTEYKKIQEWLKKCKDIMADYYGSANQQGIDELKPLLQFVNRSQNKSK
ncbi:glutathione S-transferase 3-like [Acyrthosiphon pisum]|uniref:Uncharacterized protein n=1 Tax=Acyrthosiphon pisum TaxID=7029 RepID=A0A8R2D5D9_ACYPI|nr:glutathione S-transferase 3-like [Acyrthosiphon pisum]|eukprot:XP_016662291.1 PREDICTED: glutathione S-transferase 3-like [Acyrthosiphon pisum]